MSSGKVHDVTGIFIGSIVAGMPLALHSINHSFMANPPFEGGFIFTTGISIILGTLYLSPDLDVFPNRSVCQQRWDKLGILGIHLGYIWEPYRREIGHRHYLSHSILIGSAVRLAYLGFWIYLITLIPAFNGFEPIHFLMRHREYVIASLIGIELSALIHYFLDGLIWDWIGDLMAYGSGGKKKKPKRRKPVIPKSSRRGRQSRRNT